MSSEVWIAVHFTGEEEGEAAGVRVLKGVDLACFGGLEQEGPKGQMVVGVVGSI